MRKLWSTLVAVLFSGGIAAAAFIPFLTPNSPAGIACSEPSQSLYCYNQIIGTVNSYLGLVGALPGPQATTATTAEQTLATTVIPPGTLSVPGQTLRLRCGGTTAGNVDLKAAKLYFGTGATVSTGNFGNNFTGGVGTSYELELLVTAVTATANSVYIGRGSITGAASVATAVNPTVGNDLTDNLSNGVTVKCTATLGLASAGDLTQQLFLIEQVK